MKNISIITLNKTGLETAKNIIQDLFKINPEFNITVFSKHPEIKEIICKVKIFDKIDNEIENIWNNSDTNIWLTTTDIVIRKIAPFIESKNNHPSVIVINPEYTQILPLLSGNTNEANELSTEITKVNPNLVPFITTATDTMGVFAFDTLAKRMNWEIINISGLTNVSNALINDETINLISYKNIFEFLKSEGLNDKNINFFNIEESLHNIDPQKPSVIISPFVQDEAFNRFDNSLQLRIKPVTIGIELKQNTPCEELKENLLNFINKNSLNIKDIKAISSFELQSDEPGLWNLAQNLNVELKFFSQNSITNLNKNTSDNEKPAKPSAMLASQFKILFAEDNTYQNSVITAAF